ncbi:MAG: 1-deoxy-D-xylulose-5-phosphate reductoisomerase [Ruminococcus sp.]|nr:1-deoxy-D-xylulose-5-phosphate reductoisomerase [Ruminococcus sp.]
MQTITILGSTGSIGTQALQVARKHNMKVKAVAAASNVKMLAEQAKELDVSCACIYNADKKAELDERLSGTGIKTLTGMDGLKEIASLDGVDKMLNSVVGMVGFEPTLAAIRHGTAVALANKETLVAGGDLVMREAHERGVPIYPVDSEHSAIFQALQGNDENRIRKIILTASGGPFFGKKREELAGVTVDQALAHPNWSMGRKITTDSATLMNKGLEFIEAMHLFGVSAEQIEIVVHRQSVVHSAVEFEDNSVIAQMGVPDMKIPIQYALLYPKRVECEVGRLSLTDYGSLTFERPDYETFECLTSCIEAIKRGGTLPAAVNGANEVAVAAFLDGRIGFLDIGRIVKTVGETAEYKEIHTENDVLEADACARRAARELIG